MQNYRSVEEKAAEWNLSQRHVQHLCRNGKIAGAIKHAEVWFIPQGALSPAQKTKAGGKDFGFVGTKKKIFYSSIDLFVLHGVDSVSLKDIGDKVGVRQSTIYNHFKSKQQILDTIYDFYCLYYQMDRPSLEDMAVKLQTDSLMDIIKAVCYEFKAEYLQAMNDISKIIFQRMGVDERAKEIAKKLIAEDGIKYVEDVFNLGIESGRFAPFDTHALAVLINSIRIFTLFYWIIDPLPESMTKVLADEQQIYEYAGRLIKDLRFAK